MKKQYAWDQVDRLAEEWYATPAGEEHAAIKQKLLEEFLGLSCNLLSESMMEGLGDFWEQDFQHFDPALSQAACPFWTFSWTGSAGLSPAWPAARPGPMASWWRAARTSPWSSPCPRTCIAVIWPGRRGAGRACPPSPSSGRPIGPF